MVQMRALVSCLLSTLAAVSVTARHGCGIGHHTAQDVIQELGLVPNVEGGYYVETFEDDLTVLGNYSASTAIYYLLEGSEGQSRWHRVGFTEIWHHYAGAPLNLSLSWNNDSALEVRTLGKDIFHGQRPQIVVEKQQWQSAQSLGNWTLVGTTVAPGFDNSVYTLAPVGFVPNSSYTNYTYAS